MRPPLDLHALAGTEYKLTWSEPVRSARSHPGVGTKELPWYRRIPCKHGWIGTYNHRLLLAYCAGRCARSRLESVPGLIVRQRGDEELSASFPASQLPLVAAILGARKRRHPDHAIRRCQ